MMMLWFSLWLMQDAPAPLGQRPNVQRPDVQAQAQRVRAAMQASIEMQKASVALQVRALKAAGQSSDSARSDANPTVSLVCEPIAKADSDEMIGQAAERELVDPALVREVVREESNFYPCAASPAGAVGLMQLMPATQAQFQVNDPTDPQESLTAGTKLLKLLIDRYDGNLKLVLGAYNAGIGAVDRIQDVPQIPETQKYVEDILERLRVR